MENSEQKSLFHPNNKFKGKYDFQKLKNQYPQLSKYLKHTKHGSESFDFLNQEAVFELNRVLLVHYYGIKNWELPKGFLCPAIPGRADYIHYVAELIASNNLQKIKCLDIGVGASMIFPIVGIVDYNWQFVGAEINNIAIDNIAQICKHNPQINSNLQIRKQPKHENIFNGIIKSDEYFDLTICNPPFFKSIEEAESANKKRISKVTNTNQVKANFNFGGNNNELWCDGGELSFVKRMIEESKLFKNSCLWFTTLVSKKGHLQTLKIDLDKAKIYEYRIIEMMRGNKIRRILAWTFLNEQQQKNWKETKWK